METIDHECYVSLEVAKLLKEAGFGYKTNILYFSMPDDDFPIKEELVRCTDYFLNGDNRGTGNPFHNWNQLNTNSSNHYIFVSKNDLLELDSEIIKGATLISAPTLDVTQRWLRETKNISIEVKTCRWVNRYQDGKYTVSYRHELWPIDTSIVPNDEDKFIRYTIDYACNIEFQTYEEAQEAGIKKALKLLLEKGE